MIFVLHRTSGLLQQQSATLPRQAGGVEPQVQAQAKRGRRGSFEEGKGRIPESLLRTCHHSPPILIYRTTSPTNEIHISGDQAHKHIQAAATAKGDVKGERQKKTDGGSFG